MRELNVPASPFDYAHVLLILLAFALFATDHLVHYPLALMAVFGVGQILRAPRELAAPAARQLLLLFALIWLPMIFALHDAVDLSHATKTVLSYLHFFPAAFYLVTVCGRPVVYRMVSSGVVVLVLFAVFDAFAQLIWRADLFGYPYNGDVLHGVFYPKQRLGLFLGALAPLYVDVIRRWCRTFPALWLVLIPLVIVMLTSLKRSGWVMLAIGLGVYFLLRRTTTDGVRMRTRLLQLSAILLVVVLTAVFNPSVRHQMARSSGLFSGDIATIDQASGYRVSLWHTGYRIFVNNWLDGVGPRGYRKVYVDYAPADDFWIARGTNGQTHPHLMALEIAVETGLCGMLGFVAFYVVLCRLLLRARERQPGAVWMLCAAVAWLPLNTHMAFYGSYWSTLTWLLIGVGLGAYLGRRAPPAADVVPSAAAGAL